MTVLLLSAAGPLVLSICLPLRFYRDWKALLAAIFIIVFVFGAWDIWAVARGHWHFSPQGVWGPRVANLPVEEVLFFVVIPFCGVFTWEAFKRLGLLTKK